MSGKRVSAADMLGRRKDQSSPQTIDQSQRPAEEQVGTTSQRGNAATTSIPVAQTSSDTYERITVYVRPGQRSWVEDVLDREVRDSSGKRMRSISASDIIRLAIDHLQGAVQNENFPLLQELIRSAQKDAETFAGRKNRGLPTG